MSDPELPPYVSDCLSAISNIPMQFLMSAGMVAVIMAAASLGDFIPKLAEWLALLTRGKPFLLLA